MRNIGNIISPYGAANGGEGAAVEYAVQELGIRNIIVCGHSHCGAMKGLLQIGHLAEEMPLVYNWLKYAEATRRVLRDNYQGVEGEELLNAAIEENVLTQIENLRTYPAIYSKIHSGKLQVHAWVYRIETGGIYVYSAERCSIRAEHEEDEMDENAEARSPLPTNNGKTKSHSYS